MKQHTAVILRRTIPAVAAFYFVHRVSWLYRHVRGGSVLSRLSVTFGNLSLDENRHVVTVHGKPVMLTLKEFDLLRLFMDHLRNDHNLEKGSF